MYLDSTRSLKRGRLIPKSDAVPNPTFVHLLKAIKQLQLPQEIFAEQYKKHPRDQLNPGRIRIQFFNENHEFQIPGYANVKAFYVALAKVISGIQETEVQHKESKKLVLDQKQKKANSEVRAFKDDKKAKKKKGRH